MTMTPAIASPWQNVKAIATVEFREHSHPICKTWTMCWRKTKQIKRNCQRYSRCIPKHNHHELSSPNLYLYYLVLLLMIENCHLFLYIFISDHALSPWTRPVHLFILFQVQICDALGIRLHMASNGYMCLPKRLLNAALPAHTEFVSYAHAACTHFSHCQWYFLSPVYTMTEEQLGLMWNGENCEHRFVLHGIGKPHLCYSYPLTATEIRTSNLC